jgi:hypothetical protein
MDIDIAINPWTRYRREQRKKKLFDNKILWYVCNNKSIGYLLFEILSSSKWCIK